MFNGLRSRSTYNVWQPSKFNAATRRAASLFGLAILVITTSSTAASATEEQANAHYEAERWEEAAESFLDVVLENEDNATAWYRLGVSQQMLGNFYESIQTLESALTKGAYPSYTKFQIAKSWVGAGDLEAGYRTLKEAADLGYSDFESLTTFKKPNNLGYTNQFAVVEKQIRRNSSPCRYDIEHRQFDFWVGTWTVKDSSGRIVGSNVINKDQEGCVLVENWTSAGGFAGQSINYYDPHAGHWTQKWVSPSSIIDISGEWSGKEMVLTGSIYEFVSGNFTAFRGTWTPLDDGRVEQLFEQHDAEMSTWNEWFRGFYELKSES